MGCSGLVVERLPPVGYANVHDLSVVKLPQPSASVIEVRYDRGVATIRS
jgi:hypothetical protein